MTSTESVNPTAYSFYTKEKETSPTKASSLILKLDAVRNTNSRINSGILTISTAV